LSEQRIHYGPDPEQFGELSLPTGTGPWPVVAIIHGGFWRAGYDLGLGRPLARDLVRRGFAAWNVEYRRVGNGGGWPTTTADVAAAVDHLAVMAEDALRQGEATLDLGRVIAVGHSAGGQLAAWLAGVDRPRVPVAGVVSQAGVLDLAGASAARLGNGAVDDFLGPDWAGDWAQVSPAHRLPIDVPIRCVHGDLDDSVPISQSEEYVAAARRLAGDAELITLRGGDHFGVITPGDPGWAACVRAVEELA
jgi:acetyl esterase/lipase